MPALTNAVVTFRNPATGQTITNVAVHIRNRDRDIHVSGFDPAYPWLVAFDPNITYADGTPPRSGHFIHYAPIFGSDSQGNAKGGQISKPRPSFGVIPTMVAHFKEQP